MTKVYSPTQPDGEDCELKKYRKFCLGFFFGKFVQMTTVISGAAGNVVLLRACAADLHVVLEASSLLLQPDGASLGARAPVGVVDGGVLE